jgi:hypothetical protein
VNRAFTIKFTEFFDLETAGHIPFFFCAGIIPAFAFCTFQNNQFTHFQTSGQTLSGEQSQIIRRIRKQ